MLTLNLKDFDIEQIADSGQCFRMYQVDKEAWDLFALDRFLRVRRNLKSFTFECEQKEFDEFWFNYFDLQTDYGEIKRRIIATGDPYLVAAVNYGSGLRILRQDLWEMIVSIVVSQQNNIPRIRGCLKKLCEINGGKFPKSEDFLRFTKDELASVKLGYREKYLIKISEAVVNREFDLDGLKRLSCEQAISYLKSLYGVGDKVANCIALFGLYHINAFPIDVWIKRIIDNRYNGVFSLEQLGLSDIGGIVQQYMFFYERSSKRVGS